MSADITPLTGGPPDAVIWMATDIRQMPIDALKAYANSTRTHADRDVGRIADAIRQFGFVVPILLDAENTIVAGHGRVAAARRLGMDTVPTVCVDHLSKAEIRALRIADNRLAELSDWNRDALQIEFADLLELSLDAKLDFDLTITGFEIPEIDLIIGGGGEAPDAPPETVEAPDRSQPAVSRRGDLWQLGPHRILCADALTPRNWRRLLAGETAQMVFTDPPYNVPVNGHVRSSQDGGHREFAMASGEMSDAEFRGFLATALGGMLPRLADGGIAMVCMDWRHVEPLIAVARACGLELINLCVWNKSNGGMGSLYRSKHELVCIFRKPGAAHINNVELGRHGRNRTNVWDYPGVNSFGAGRTADLADHPTVKPTALVADAILDVTRLGDVVIDGFGGSGATLLAAEKTGRRARLIEIDPVYVDVAIRRWQDLTGKVAVHAFGDETWNQREAMQVAASKKELADVKAG